VSIAVGVLFVAVAAWVLFGWPGDLGDGQRVGALDHAAAARPRL
jgi:hypothetical protein